MIVDDVGRRGIGAIDMTVGRGAHAVHLLPLGHVLNDVLLLLVMVMVLMWLHLLLLLPCIARESTEHTQASSTVSVPTRSLNMD